MPYWAFLAFLLVVSALLRNGRMAWTAGLLLANWGANTWIATVTGSQFNWAAMALVDYLTAALILSVPLTRWQILVACLYAYELVAHAAYAWVGPGPWSDYRYWYALSWGAWAQAWVVAGWGGHDTARAIWNRIGAGRRARIAQALPFGLGADHGGSR